jgi:hypothetical protein
MQPRSIILAASILLNGAGVAAFAIRPEVVPANVRAFLGRQFGRETEKPASTPPRATKPPAPTPLWRKLDAGGDLPTLVARLRRAGFPADVIRAMIQAEIGARYDGKMRALFEPDPSTPFWKLASTYLTAGDNRMEQYSQLQRERSKLLRELLADPFFATDDVTAAQRRQYGNLSSQKIDLLRRIEDDYAEMGAAVRSATQGIMLPEDRAKLDLLARERRADLARVLSPEELADYDFRSSPLTGTIARQLGGFEASEAEFRAIFQAQNAFSEKLGPVEMGPGTNMRELQGASRQLHAQLKASLGETRFADYIRETDRTYQQLVQLTQRENLPPEAAVRAFNLRETVALESGRIVDSTSLTLDQKRAALQTLADSTRQQILGLLGPTTSTAYLKVIDGQWLNRVQQGNAVSFAESFGSFFTSSGGSGSSITSVTASFGVNPSFRGIAPPAPPPPPPR